MLRTTLLSLLFTSLFTTAAFGQKILLADDFNDNRNGWRLQHDSSFLVDIKNGCLHIEKFEKNFISRGCLWYNKIIPGLNTSNDFSITLYAKFLHGGDVVDMIDLQWGENQRRENGRIVSNLYQLSFLMKGEVKLDYFNRNWTYFVRKQIKPLLENQFDPTQLNKYELIQKDSFIVFRINDKEVLKQFYSPVAGNSIGFQQCLKSAWEIDKIVIRQGDNKKNRAFDSTRTFAAKQPNADRLTEKDLLVYPNPFTNDLSVRFYLEKEETVQLYLIDMNGTVLQQHNKLLSAGPQNIHIYADVVPGSYVLKVQTGKKLLTSTVIKQ